MDARAGFQSLEGIWGFWNLFIRQEVSIGTGFNPWKGFGGFGTALSMALKGSNQSFNPWKGFGGFGTPRDAHGRWASAGFNPWKGFGGFGTPIQSGSRSYSVVSIPGRDLGVLELNRVDRVARYSSCFNPWKGFGGFGTSQAICGLPQMIKFQSLEGIWGFWNVIAIHSIQGSRRVSIPGRDLGVLEQH